jgi:hypothetical protein
MTPGLSPAERKARALAIQEAVRQYTDGEEITQRCPECGGLIDVIEVGGPPDADPNVFDVSCPGGDLDQRFWGI